MKKGTFVIAVCIILMMSALFPQFLPIFSDRDSGGGGKTDPRQHTEMTEPRSGFSVGENIHSFWKDEISLIPPDKFYDFSGLNTPLFRIKPVTNPRYWRMCVYSSFDGEKWHIDREDSTETYYYNNEETYTVEGKFDGFLPASAHVKKLICRDACSFGGNYMTTDAVDRYYFTSVIYDISDLDGDSFASSDKYTRLPKMEESIEKLAKEAVGSSEKPLDKIKSIVDYLAGNYSFSVRCSTSSLHQFLLQEKRGYSLHFASAFVVIARMNGIPARLAIGYSPGLISDGYRYILEGHRHAWAEVLFKEHGWISVECTPPNAKPGEGLGLSSAGIDANVINFFKDYTLKWWYMNIPDYIGGDGGGTCRGGYMPVSSKAVRENDADGDELSDDSEIKMGSNPYSEDTDMNGIDDLTEVRNGMKPYLDDEDGDGLSDYEELKIYGTNPKHPDTDGGGNCDGQEVRLERDPLDPSDDWEFRDYDGDRVPDRIEVQEGTDPKSPDTDGDCLPDNVEMDTNTDPSSSDTDHDGIEDGEEVLILMTDPKIPMKDEAEEKSTHMEDEKDTKALLAFLLICIMVLVTAVSAFSAHDYMLRKTDIGYMLRNAVEKIERIDVLKDEDSIRMEVFRIYREFCRILEEKGYVREEAWTLVEFERIIEEKMHIPKELLRKFTSLIEEAVYSNHVLDEEYKGEVITCFNEISDYFLQNR